MDVSDWSVDRWLAIAFFVIGFLATYITYKKSHKESKPQYRSTLFRLIGPYSGDSPFTQTDVNLKVQYGTSEAESVSKIYMTLWNAGRETLDMEKSRIEAEKVKITLPPGCEFWGTPKILKQTRPSLNFSTRIVRGARHVAEVDFDFLNRHDGAILEFLCTGPADKYEVTGDFKSSRPLKRRGKLLLGMDLSYRDRWIKTAAELIGVRYWRQWENIAIFLGLLLIIILFSLDSRFFTGIITTFLATLFIISVSAIDNVTPANWSRKKQSGSWFGIPRNLQRIPLQIQLPPKKDRRVSSFFKDLSEEVSGRN